MLVECASNTNDEVNGLATHLTRNRQNDLQYVDDDPREYLFNWGMTWLIFNINYRAHVMAVNVTDQSLARQLLTVMF